MAETEIFRKVFRDSDIIARMGGDEIVVIAFDMKKSNIRSIRARLNKACLKWNEKTEFPFRMSISIGASEFNEKHYDLESLLNKADESLYKAKRIRHMQLANMENLEQLIKN